MIIKKSELTKKLSRLKAIVPKNTSILALRGVLISEGYITANNLEMAVKLRMEGCDGDNFIIPETAFKLIENLPEGDIEINAADDNSIIIQTDEIKNECKTIPYSQFPLPAACDEDRETTIDAARLIEAIKRVGYAISQDGSKPATNAMCLQALGGNLNFVGLNGAVVAWDKMPYDGTFELLIPKNTADKLKSIGLTGSIKVKHTNSNAVFITEGAEIYTRLMEGEYFNYPGLFENFKLHIKVDRERFLEAVTRAKLCNTEQRSPIKLEINDRLTVTLNNIITSYYENVVLDEQSEEPITIAFNAQFIIETLKVMDCKKVKISFNDELSPALLEDEDSLFKAIVLPVKIPAGGVRK